jgi:hypothetical protein
VCAGRILLHRALEIGAVLGRAVEEGHSLGFMTLTMRHDRSQSLDELWGAARRGWTRAITGRGWIQAADAVDGWVRVWEVTHGRNGWHVHVHLVLVLDGSTTPRRFQEVASGMFDRWSRGLVAAGLRAPLRRGQEWHLVAGDTASADLGGYLAKMADSVEAAALGLELTHSQPGRSSYAHRTRPTWALLDDLAETGEASALRLWNEWESVSRGKRQVGWSVGLRERFAPEVDDLTDDEVVAQELGTQRDDVVHLTAPAWRELVSGSGRIVALLEAVEASDVAAFALLDGWGVPWTAAGGRGLGRSPSAPARPASRGS